ncbi:SDR family NAD(P)-dependent oxidoreductase [Haloarcula marina]|uniref:SDR family NAD(P)-dependent oxidoreductase n=1 Tax=Haloarcula marina TaxID=2961574 RepID=UPI0020B76D81|nr:SDR family oxidoreductase [Halomicroarcula marina]
MQFEADDRLTDMHIVVTGGARGIGRGIAVRCAQANADVSIFDNKPDIAAETRDLIERTGGNASIFEVDVTDPEAVEQAVADARAVHGPIHGLVNNAGVQHLSPILELSPEEWDFHLDVNAKGTLLCSKHCALAMLDDEVSGSIVNIASSSADAPHLGQGAYGASKGAVETLTISLARELGEHDITANAIKPGGVETPMYDEWAGERANLEGVPKEEILECGHEGPPVGRIGEPADIGHMIVLLLSDEGEWVSGASIALDGGGSSL